ncbi:MAG: alkaline phosphatase family protein [Acidobacteriota bacterium]
MLIAVLLLIGCVVQTGFTQPVKNKVILINIRGASKQFIDLSLKKAIFDKPSAFRFLKKNAQISSALEPIPNAVRAVNNATLETGVYPETHGIVGNSFGEIIDDKVETASGFNSPFLAETI